ncbi:MAG: hypothetical protein DRG78_03615 [Epsilonproteobacteria bacterium]|nr:MAG: hypothetical protein DRG78_03615 [Campylobacterota bacterium]
MSGQLKNKIEATDTSINNLLKDKKFYIDYFQRDYRWQDKHIKLLIEDLTTTFLKSYNSEDKRAAVANYQNYYLGPVVFSINPENNKKSIIDGQQRITSITLLLIYLNNLQSELSQQVEISGLIFSEKFGEKSFNMSDKQREPCLWALFEHGEFIPQEDDDETVVNMIARYEDITQAFPEELSEEALPFFIDWLIENVVIVEIIAYSDENAYTIFETMNDRGLNLTPSEMLKGYVLSRITDSEQRIEINTLWKNQIQKLHEYGENADQSFFQTWFRSKYAISIRPGKAGSVNQDFELIGSGFHNWFKDNHKNILNLTTSDDIYKFFKEIFPFYVKWYLKSWDSQITFNKVVPHLHYIHYLGIAESLQDPILLASINFSDDEDIINKKLDYTSRYIETFTVRRSVNYKKFGQTSIKYTMFNLVKLIRNNDLNALSLNLINEVNNIDQQWDKVINFGLHGQNRKIVKHLLSRISGYIDNLVGKDTDYTSYKHPDGKQFEIEHIWGDKFDEHRDEFEQEGDFQASRNSIGALILLPNGTNQSFSSDNYEKKLEHYIKENTYAQTLHPSYYVKNPNFLKSDNIKELNFEAHKNFTKDDIKKRDTLVKKICKQIWTTDYFIDGIETSI